MFEHIFHGVAPDAIISTMHLVGERRLFKYYRLQEFLQNTFEGNDWYYSPAPRTSESDQLEAVLGTRVLWVDAQAEQIRPTLPASIIVHSGGGWHVYWLLNTFIGNVDRIAELNSVVRDDLDGDAIQNANRFLRIPGTFNAKQPTLRPVEIRTLRPGLTYSIEDIRVLEHLTSVVKHKIRTGDTRGYGADRSRRDWAIITDLVKAGASDELIIKIFTYQPCGDKFRDPSTNGPEYMQHTLERARKSPVTRLLSSNVVETSTGYLAVGPRGEKRISTFIINPKMLLMSEKGDAIVGDVSTGEYVWKDVTFPREAFNDRKALDKYLTISAWSWLGKDDDVRLLLPFLLEKLKTQGLPKTKATVVLGRHGTCFVGAHQTIKDGVIYEGTLAPIVYLNTGKTQLPIEYFEGDVDVKDLVDINEINVIYPVLGWFMATPYKPVFEDMGVRFPILDVFGTKGSGKTSLIRVFQTLMGYLKPLMTDCRTTRFVVLTLLGMSNSIPIAFSEYRHAGGESVLRFVLLSYDTGHDARGRSDQSVQGYDLTAPFSLDGEDVIADPAAKERIIAVPLHPETIAEGTAYYIAYNNFVKKPLRNFAAGYIMFTLRQNVEALLEAAKKRIQEAFPGILPARVRSNIEVCTAGIISWCTYVGVSEPDYRAVFKASLETVWNESMGRGTTLVDSFIEAVANAVSLNAAHFFYRVREGKYIWFQLATTFDWWMRQRRMVQQNTLDKEAIRLQLMERYMSKGSLGQYIIEPKPVDGRFCFGIDLAAASAAGLDVPDRIDLTQMVVHLGGK